MMLILVKVSHSQSVNDADVCEGVTQSVCE